MGYSWLNPCTMSRKCHLAAPETAAMSSLGRRAALEERTELRWLSFQRASRHYPS
jgi:hypothetical protein